MPDLHSIARGDHGRFKCPKCGSLRWGTSMDPALPEPERHAQAEGHCNAWRCDFRWNRATEDESVGLRNCWEAPDAP